MFIAHFAVGFATTRVAPPVARVGALAAVLVAGHLGTVMRPPPPSVSAVYVSAIVIFVIVLVWSWWAEKA